MSMDKKAFDKNVIVSEPSDWKASPMKEVDRLLRCPICFDFFQIPMILPCSHSFCSLCIRRYLQYKNNCPICSKPATVGNLLNNVLVGQLCTHFIKHRKELLRNTLSHPVEENYRVENELPLPSVNSSEGEEGHLVPSPPQTLDLSEDNKMVEEIESSGQKKKEELEEDCKKKKREEEEGAFQLPHSPSLFESSGCSTRKANKHDLCFGDLHIKQEEDQRVEWENPRKPVFGMVECDSDVKQQDTDINHRSQRWSPAVNPACSTADNNVECPVCGIQLLTRHVNNHLDICLAYSNSRENTAAVGSPHVLPRLPKLCYTIMNNTALKRKLREYHLPTAGSREALISRLKEFTLQYNAQCDSTDPKSIKDIAVEVGRLEKARITPQRKPKISLHLSKSSTEEETEKELTRYATAHKDEFDSLISGIRKRLLTSNVSSEEANVSGDAVERKESRRRALENTNEDVKHHKRKKRRYQEDCSTGDDDPDFEPGRLSKETV